VENEFIDMFFSILCKPTSSYDNLNLALYPCQLFMSSQQVPVNVILNCFSGF